jgi:2-oxoglutarate ferredoxin oxidoreductase subunit gamma
MLIVLFQEAYEKFRSNLGTGGLLLLESSLVTPRAEDADAIRLPAIEIAAELGNKLAANLVLLGYLVGATDVVSRNAMENAIHEMVDERHLDLDMQAFGAGVDLAARAGGD